MHNNALKNATYRDENSDAYIGYCRLQSTRGVAKGIPSDEGCTQDYCSLLYMVVKNVGTARRVCHGMQVPN